MVLTVELLNVKMLEVSKAAVSQNKCDLDLYKSVVNASLSRITIGVECTLDADLLVKSLTSSLRKASEAACPKPKKKKSGKGLPIWNDSIANAVHASKKAHVLWKKDGSLTNPTCPFFTKRRETRKSLKKAARFAFYQQRQEFLVTVMDANEHDIKMFYKLVKKQRARTSTATESLQYDGICRQV